MNWPLLAVILTQILFSISDLMARMYMPKHGFALASFISGWFVVYTIIRIFATFGQLYVFTAIDLGKTMALFGAVSIIIANLLGYFLLKEVLSPSVYVGVTLVLIAFFIMALK